MLKQKYIYGRNESLKTNYFNTRTKLQEVTESAYLGSKIIMDDWNKRD